MCFEYMYTTKIFRNTLATLSTEGNSIESLSIFPNPANDFIYIETESTPKRTVIYTMLGTEVLKTTTKRIDVSSLSQGMYTVQIETQKGAIITKNIIKQ
jgi:hypothetical protein